MRLAAIAAALAALLAFGAAWKIQGLRWTAVDAERAENDRETQRLRARTADQASAGHEADKETTRVEFRTIYRDVERVVERPVYRSVCLDDDGLRLIAAAIAGSAPAPAQPAPALRGPAAPH